MGKNRVFALLVVLAGVALSKGGFGEEVVVEGPKAYANVQACFSSLSEKMPYVLSGRGIGEYYYNRIQLSSFLPDGTRFVKGPLPLAQYFGEPMPSIFAEKMGKANERIAVGVGWGYVKRKEDNLRGVFVCVAISRVVPKDKRWGYVVASVDVPKLYWKGGDSGQMIRPKR
jgi:hypothetical protein